MVLLSTISILYAIVKVDDLEIALFDSGVMVPDGATISGLGERSKLVTGLSQEQIIYLSSQIDKLKLKINRRVIRSRPFVAGTPVQSMNVNTDQDKDKDNDSNMASPSLRQQPETSGSVPSSRGSASTTEPSSASKIPGLAQTDIAKAKKKEERRKRKEKKKEKKQKAREAVMGGSTSNIQYIIKSGGIPGLVHSDSSDTDGSYSDNDSLYDTTPADNASQVSSAKTLPKIITSPAQPNTKGQSAGKRGASSPVDQDVQHKKGNGIPRPGQQNNK